MMLGDLAPEDHGDLVGLPDGPIGVEQAFAELVEGGAAPEDQIVAELDLREEQPMLAAGVVALVGGKKRRQPRQPLLPAAQDIPCREPIGERLQAVGRRAADEGIGALPEGDAVLAHAVGEPMMLIEADAGGERKVGADAHEYPAPLPVVGGEVGLDDPTVGDWQMPTAAPALADP